jgi:(S)-2-hydroxyglutarate dehydrogenase
MTRGLRCAVIGGGILGAAVARELSRRPNVAAVTLYEKEDRVAAHQTGHNSGVVHAGLYYEPGSLKAKLCRRGGDLLRDFCAQHSLPLEQCGKLVIALEAEELPRLHNVFDRARLNKVPGVRLLNPDEIREIEPNARGLAALHSPQTSIVDYAAVTKALVDDFRQTGGTVLLGRAVTSVRPLPDGAAVTSAGTEERFDLVVVCAGLQSDRLARSAGGNRDPRIVPFFGQYFVLEPKYRDILNGLVYPVPDPRYPFLGVHLTKRIDGEMTLGPNAFVAAGREAYKATSFNIRDLASIAAFPGFWQFSSRNLRAASREFRTVVSPKAFRRDAERFVPALSGAKLIPSTRGVRAQAMTSRGQLVDDFVITRDDRLVQVRNAPSPGATSSLAIAEHIVEETLNAL